MRVFFREVTASQEVAEDKARQSLFMAWHSGRYAAMAKTKKGLPDLKDEMNKLGRRHAVVPQSPTVMRAVLHLIGLKEQRL